MVRQRKSVSPIRFAFRMWVYIETAIIEKIIEKTTIRETTIEEMGRQRRKI